MGGGKRKNKKKYSSKPAPDRSANDAKDDFTIQMPRRKGSAANASQRRGNADTDSTTRRDSSDDVSTNSAETARSSISTTSGGGSAEPAQTTTDQGMESLSRLRDVTLPEHKTHSGDVHETRTQHPLGDDAREPGVTDSRTTGEPSDPNPVVNTHLTDAHEHGMTEGDWDFEHQTSQTPPDITTPEMHPSDLGYAGVMPPARSMTVLANTTPATPAPTGAATMESQFSHEGLALHRLRGVVMKTLNNKMQEYSPDAKGWDIDTRNAFIAKVLADEPILRADYDLCFARDDRSYDHFVALSAEPTALTVPPASAVDPASAALSIKDPASAVSLPPPASAVHAQNVPASADVTSSASADVPVSTVQRPAPAVPPSPAKPLSPAQPPSPAMPLSQPPASAAPVASTVTSLRDEMMARITSSQPVVPSRQSHDQGHGEPETKKVSSTSSLSASHWERMNPPQISTGGDVGVGSTHGGSHDERESGHSPLAQSRGNEDRADLSRYFSMTHGADSPPIHIQETDQIRLLNKKFGDRSLFGLTPIDDDTTMEIISKYRHLSTLDRAELQHFMATANRHSRHVCGALFRGLLSSGPTAANVTAEEVIRTVNLRCVEINRFIGMNFDLQNDANSGLDTHFCATSREEASRGIAALNSIRSRSRIGDVTFNPDDEDVVISTEDRLALVASEAKARKEAKALAAVKRGAESLRPGKPGKHKAPKNAPTPKSVASRAQAIFDRELAEAADDDAVKAKVRELRQAHNATAGTGDATLDVDQDVDISGSGSL